MNLSDSIKNRDNNFDLIRLLSAVLVVFSHSFPISMGFIGDKQDPDPLALLCGVSLGHVGVAVFFIVSGFLITYSFERSSSLSSYAIGRALRIVPGLWANILVTIFVIGPLAVSTGVGAYFQDPRTYGFLTGMVLKFQTSLPGVFTENPLPQAVNGALWTLTYEIKFYIVVAILGWCRCLRPVPVLVLFLLAVGLNFVSLLGHNTSLFIYFGSGMLFCLMRERVRFNAVGFLLCAALAIVVFAAELMMKDLVYAAPFIAVASAYLILYVAYALPFKLPNAARYGDFSYGIYIYGFPVQQLVASFNFFPGSWWGNFFLSMPPIFLLAIASWHCVERQALKFKPSPLGRSSLGARAQPPKAA